MALPALDCRQRAGRARCGLLVLLAAALLPVRAAFAAVAEPDGRPDEAFDVMNALADNGLHDLWHERWNAYGQLTWISSFKLPFAAAYTNRNGSNRSLLPDFEHSFTATATLYLGLRLWPGAEVYVVPEVIAERPLSNLSGLGGAIQNFELQKTGTAAPSLYRSRAYFRQTVGFGGGKEQKTSDPMQLGTEVDARRLVLTLGNFSVLDVLDKNPYAGDLRRQFFNMAFLTHAAYDFAADARGYAWGGMVEVHVDAWALRLGRFTAPLQPNQLAVDVRLDRHYGDQVELEHRHSWRARPGALRLVVFHNHEAMARFDEAIAAWRANPQKNAANCQEFSYGSGNADAPDLCWARRENDKVGGGLNLDQEVVAGVGFFLRAFVADGASEVYSYTAADRSLSLGALATGEHWGRPDDRLGLGSGVAWISKSHAQYLGLGGVDGFVGDGGLDVGPEGVGEVFYSLNVLGPMWFSGDFQRIWNPGFNRARGPVDIVGARFHAEF